MRAAALLLFLVHVAFASPSRSLQTGLDPSGDTIQASRFSLPSESPVSAPSPFRFKGFLYYTQGYEEPASAPVPTRRLPRSTSLPSFKGKPGSSVSVSSPPSLHKAKSSPAFSTAGSVSVGDRVALEFQEIVGSITKELRRNPPTSKAKEWELVNRAGPLRQTILTKLESARTHFKAMKGQVKKLLSNQDPESVMHAFAAYIVELIHLLRDMELVHMALDMQYAIRDEDVLTRIYITSSYLKGERRDLERMFVLKVPRIAAYLTYLPRLMLDTFGIRVKHDEDLFGQLVGQINKRVGWYEW